MLKLHDSHSLKLLCFVYGCTNNSTTSSFQNFFDQLQTVHIYNKRQASEGNIYLPGVHTTHSMGRDQPNVLAELSGII